MLDWRWMGRQLALVGTGLLMLYAVGVAGTLNGLVVVPIRVLTLALLLVFGSLWLWRGRSRRDLPLFVTPLLGLLLALAVTTLLSADSRRGLTYLGYVGAFTLAYWMVADAASGQEIRLELALHVALALLVVLSGFELFGWLRANDWRVVAPYPRPSSLMDSPNIYATLLLVALPLVARRAVVAARWLRRVLWALWLVVLGLSVILAGSRGAWLGAFLGGLVFVAMSLDAASLLSMKALRARLRAASPVQKALLALLALAALAAVVAAVPVVSAQAAASTHGSAAKRFDIWNAALAQFARTPLFGRGPFTYGDAYLERISSPPETPHNHAHNVVLNVAAEMGLVGLAALAALAWTAIRALRRQRRVARFDDRLKAAAAAALLVAVVTHNLFDVTLIPSIAFATLLSLAVLLPGRVEMPLLILSAAPLRRRVAPVLWLAVLGLLAFPLPAAWAATQAADAADDGDWAAAAAHYEVALLRDPAYAIYRLDAAYVYAHLAEAGNADAADRAIDLYHAGLSAPPGYALHWANLALLEYQAGQVEAALADAQRAADLAPDAPALAELAAILASGGDATTDDIPVLSGFGQGITYSLGRWHVRGPEIYLLSLPEDVP